MWRRCFIITSRRQWPLIRHSSSSTQSNDEGFIRSKVPNIEIPNQLLQDYMSQNESKLYNKTLVECVVTKKKLTHGQVEEMSYNLSTFLMHFNYKKGDKIAVLLPNVPEYFICILGIIRAGLILTTINPGYKKAEVGRHLEYSRAMALITTNELYPIARAGMALAYLSIPVLVVKEKQSDSINRDAICFHEVVTKQHGEYSPLPMRPEDVALLPYSSGTTGMPKGVELTHLNIIANACQATSDQFAVAHEGDTVPIIVPLYHAYGLNIIAIFLYSRGVKFTLMPRFNLKSYHKILHDYPPHVLFLVPPLVLILINHPELQADKLTELRHIISAAAPIGTSDVERLETKMGRPIDFLQMYGMTEAAPLTHHQSLTLPHGHKLGGCGVLLPNTQHKICDPDDHSMFKDLGPNRPGMLLVRGPQVMRGYFEDVQANEETLIEDGWLVTGDIGYYDDNHHLFITDRLKELIKVKGYQVAPAELEEVLRGHPDINDAAVVGLPDKTDGEKARAFVVKREGSKITDKEVHAYMEQHLSRHKQLKGGVVFLEEIPKTASGKILRRVLKEKYK